jgi:hypothetical protein
MNTEAVTIALVLTTIVLSIILYLWMALALSALFRKAGEEGWKGWVPFLNHAVILRLGGFSPWLILLILIPVLGQLAVWVLLVMAAHRINRSFGYGAGMTVLAALLFLIWASVLGFGSARWIGEPAPGPARTPAPSAPPAPPLVGGWTPSAQPPPAPPLGPAPAPAATAAPEPASWAPSFPAAFPAEPTPRQAPALDRDVEDSAVDPEDRLAPAPRRSGSFTPPPVPPAPPAAGEPVVPISSVPGTRSAPPAQPAPPAPAPVSRVPAPPPVAETPEPWGPEHSQRTADDSFPEPSEAISAVVGAPDAGAPRSARSSVSALYAQPEIPDDEIEGAAELDGDEDEPIDQTIIAKRRRTPWKLVPPVGSPIDIASDVVILGRRPAPDPAYPDAQLVSIPDETRTVSKTHARLELRGETWYVTDLGSTNGVLFATLMGTEVEAQPGQELEAGERFFLGDAEVRLRRSDA